MVWVAIEDTDTYEVSEFERATEEQVLDLMDGYRVDMSNPERIRERDVEDGHIVVYDGAIYRGGFGINLLVAKRYVEM